MVGRNLSHHQFLAATGTSHAPLFVGVEFFFLLFRFLRRDRHRRGRGFEIFGRGRSRYILILHGIYGRGLLLRGRVRVYGERIIDRHVNGLEMRLRRLRHRHGLRILRRRYLFIDMHMPYGSGRGRVFRHLHKLVFLVLFRDGFFFFLGSGFENAIHEERYERYARDDRERPRGVRLIHETFDDVPTARRQRDEQREYTEVFHSFPVDTETVEFRSRRSVLDQHERPKHHRKFERKGYDRPNAARERVLSVERRRNRFVEVAVLRKEIQDRRDRRELYEVTEEIYEQTAGAFFFFHVTVFIEVEHARRAADKSAK